MAFNDAVRRLNSGNLDWLLRFSSVFSTLELNLSQKLRLSPAINNELARLLTQAILVSKAANYKDRTFSRKDLIFIMNNAIEGLDDPRFFEHVIDGGDRGEMLLQMTEILSRWGNIQLRQQAAHPGAALGRAIGLLDTVPSEDFRLLDLKRQDEVSQVHVRIKEVLGATVRDLALVFVVVAFHYTNLAESIHIAIRRNHRESLKAQNDGDRTFAAIGAILDSWDSLAPSATFSRESLETATGNNVGDQAVSSFLEIFSRPMSEIRAIQNEKSFQFGSGQWRLSAFERFPVTQVDNGDFVIPNIRTFLCSFLAVVDRTLLGKLNNEYTSFLGAALELYVQRLLRNTFPQSLVVPEREYRANRNSVRGPDVILVEPKQELIAIEIKSRRVSARTRSTLDRKSFDETFSGVIKALERLPKKISHLQDKLAEYADIQEVLSTGIAGGVICVVVVPEAVFFVTQQILAHSKADENHPLNGFPYPFCIMSLETLEYAVAISIQRSTSLASVLGRFAEQAENLEMSAPASELFDCESLEPISFFGFQFFDTI